MKSEDCIFCKITRKELPSKVLFENDLNLAFLDISPLAKGHTIVIPKNHYATIEDIPEFALSELYKDVKKIAMIIHDKLQIDGYNILQNNFTAAGQVVKHFHVHIIPRNLDDDTLRVKIPRKQATEEELNNVARKLGL
ncbi:MAG: HIT family protein [Candidatus Hermodarchaeota archaeon]